MNINISNYNTAFSYEEFKKEFAGCLVQLLDKPYPFNVKFLSEEDFNNTQIIGVYDPKCCQWFTATVNNTESINQEYNVPMIKY